MDRWPTLADLPLTVDELAYDRLDPGPEYGEAAHATRRVHLLGDGHEGLGEDITLFADPEGPELALAGTWTLGSFCAHLDALEQWPNGEPEFGRMARPRRHRADEAAVPHLAPGPAG